MWYFFGLKNGIIKIFRNLSALNRIFLVSDEGISGTNWPWDFIKKEGKIEYSFNGEKKMGIKKILTPIFFSHYPSSENLRLLSLHVALCASSRTGRFASLL